MQLHFDYSSPSQTGVTVSHTGIGREGEAAPGAVPRLTLEDGCGRALWLRGSGLDQQGWSWLGPGKRSRGQRLTDSSGKAKASGWPSLGGGGIRLSAQTGDEEYEVLGPSSRHRWFARSQGLPEDFPGGTSGKEPACQCRRLGFNPWVRKIPWRRVWQPTLVFLPGESHGQRSLTGYSPLGCKESDTSDLARMPRRQCC